MQSALCADVQTDHNGIYIIVAVRKSHFSKSSQLIIKEKD